ncbi:2-oxoisovalerate dehydrogenase subunit alpha, mitochondrial [Cimex lectularius]|uniref:2-oxoisovalerate dehydrogenase subunit alpha n=1 Tax=Cimex lectularius TaxID=79782 RepID=A0A8I6TEZ4_CIMLE|nr:2-oxoisovalerate dehydrogenase subunit alpha, mitochondrial [Cimex lectularius]
MSVRYVTVLSKLFRNRTSKAITRRLFSVNLAAAEDNKNENFTTSLEFLSPDTVKTIPSYRVLDLSGQVLNKNEEPKIDDAKLVKMYETMVTLNVMDKILYDSQRQGRISFYMTSYGEEASHLGSAAALDNEDLVYAQYRETGVLLWRGFTPEECMNQCYGNNLDKGKGKQMPCHFGSKVHNFITISSPLTTQMPQAVGSAYAFKRAQNGKCVIVYFGDGAASEGDAHAAFNFSATLECPVIFFCRNNGYAISTPVKEQYRGDGIVSRGQGYGITSIRVDGNDILAVYNATLAARNYCLSNNKPVIVEAMTYRVGHHSTSDDSSAYRSAEEVKKWVQTDNPMVRTFKYLHGKNLWDEKKQSECEKEAKSIILKGFGRAEKVKKPNWTEMFTDVLASENDILMEQKEYMRKHLEKYSDCYPLQ